MKIHIYLLFILSLSILSCSDDLESTDDIFQNFSIDQIIELESMMTVELINSTHGDNNEIPMNSILAFRTGEGNYGKMLVLNNTIEEDYLEFRYELYNDNKEIVLESEFTRVRKTFTFDFETNAQGVPGNDFWWEWNEFNNGGLDGEDKFIVPMGGCIFAVFEQ